MKIESLLLVFTVTLIAFVSGWFLKGGFATSKNICMLQTNDQKLSNEILKSCSAQDYPLDRFVERMNCQGNYCYVYFKNNINFGRTMGISMCPAVQNGDFYVSMDISSNKLKIGDIVSFQDGISTTSHRIVGFCDSGALIKPDLDGLASNGCVPLEKIIGVQVMVVKR